MAFYQNLAKFLSANSTNVLLRYTIGLILSLLFLSIETLWSQDMPNGELQIKARDMQLKYRYPFSLSLSAKNKYTLDELSHPAESPSVSWL